MLDSLSFDELITQASQTARDRDWNGTLEFLLQANKILPGQAELLSAIAGTYIQLGQIEAALPFYRQVIELDAHNPSAYLNLGNALTLLNQWDEAEQVFRNGIKLDEENRQLWIGLARACLNQGKSQEGVEILAALVTSDKTDTDALILLAECYEEGNDFDSAAFLYQEVLKVEAANTIANQGIKRIEGKRQSVSKDNGQTLAQKLKILKEKTRSSALLNSDRRISVGKTPANGVVYFYGPAQTSVEIRFAPIVEQLLQNGMKVQIATRFQAEVDRTAALAVFSRPHVSEELTQGVELLSQQGVRVVVDLDEDFYQIPSAYYGYEEAGPANHLAMQRLEHVLRAASLVSVPSKQLAEIYQPKTAQVFVIPYAWDDHNPMWKKPSPQRSNRQIGILANHTQAVDIAQVNQTLGSVLGKFPDILVGVVGNLKAYEAITTVSDERKYFIPPGRLEDYPFLLAEFDVLLFPLADFPYNQSRSDLALMEAGARRVAWVATPIPSYLEWKEGGIFAAQASEWEEALELLLQSETTRQNLAKSGEQKAASRSAKEIIADWMKIVA